MSSIERNILIIVFIVLSLFLLKFIFEKQHLLQKVFFPSLLNFDTPTDIFTPKNLETFNRYKDIGKDTASKTKIVITSLVRDIEPNLDTIKEKVYSISNLFSDYRIIFVENDSKDITRQFLLEWSKEDPKVIVLGCGHNVKGECSLFKHKTVNHHIDFTRIDKMVHLRNIYLSEIKENYRDFDWMLVWDLDMMASLYRDGLLNSVGWMTENNSWDVICAHGMYKKFGKNIYYDTYAHEELEEKPLILKHKTSHDIAIVNSKLGLTIGDLPYQVKTCFGGATLYRIDRIKEENEYSTSEEGDTNIICEHTGFHNSLGATVYSNPSMIHTVLLNL